MKQTALLLVTLILSMAVVPTAVALDNGPQTVACDYKFGHFGGTEQCLILGSGTNQGISWVTFKVNKKIFRYSSSSPGTIQRLNQALEQVGSFPVTNSQAQCRPGGTEADRYVFVNGDYICIYW